MDPSWVMISTNTSNIFQLVASYHIAVSVFVVGQSEDVDVQHGAIDLLPTRMGSTQGDVKNIQKPMQNIRNTYIVPT